MPVAGSGNRQLYFELLLEFDWRITFWNPGTSIGIIRGGSFMGLGFGGIPGSGGIHGSGTEC